MDTLQKQLEAAKAELERLEEIEKAELERLEKIEGKAFLAAKKITPEAEEWEEAWANADAAKNDSDRQRDVIDRLQDELDQQVISDPQEREWVEVSAGSGYGRRYCYYEIVGSKIIEGQLVGGILVLQDEGEHDNLAGNSEAAGLQGLTLQEAEAKADALNSEGSGHNYDGCHACNWSMRIYRTHDVPRWLTYQEPTKKEIIEAAIAVYNKESGSMARLKAAIRAIE